MTARAVPLVVHPVLGVRSPGDEEFRGIVTAGVDEWESPQCNATEDIVSVQQSVTC